MHEKHEQIIIVAGRSGGHIIPGMTLAKQYKKDNPHSEIVFITTDRPLDNKILSNQPDIDHKKTIAIGEIPARFYQYPFFMIKMFSAFLLSTLSMIRRRPTKVILMGGHISIPIALAAWILRIPRELYELNAVPGKAAKFLSPFASRICVPFVQTKKFFKAKKSVVVPYPIRFDSECRSIAQSAALEQLHLDKTRKTVFILGGSQGSVFINNAIKAALMTSGPLISQIQIIHQTGSAGASDWTHWYNQRAIPALVFSYHHDLSMHYQAADLIIGRAGAGTIFETLFFQKQVILIPLEISNNNHQLYNAIAAQQTYSNLITIIRQQDLEKNKQLLGLALTHLCIQVPNQEAHNTSQNY